MSCRMKVFCQPKSSLKKSKPLGQEAAVAAMTTSRLTTLRARSTWAVVMRKRGKQKKQKKSLMWVLRRNYSTFTSSRRIVVRKHSRSMRRLVVRGLMNPQSMSSKPLTGLTARTKKEKDQLKLRRELQRKSVSRVDANVLFSAIPLLFYHEGVDSWTRKSLNSTSSLLMLWSARR